MISLMIAFLFAPLTTNDGVRCYEAKFTQVQASEQGHNLSSILLFIEDIRQIKANEYNPEGDVAVTFRDRSELWGAGFTCENHICTSFIDDDSGFRVMRIKDELLELDLDRFRVLLDLDRQRDIKVREDHNLLLRSVDLDTCAELPFYITYLEEFQP